MVTIQPIGIPAQQQVPVYQPSYNAVKIDIHNPQVNVPQATQAPIAPVVPPVIYNYPQTSLYEVPQKSVYAPKVTAQEAPKVQIPVVIAKPVAEAPVVPPPPVIIQQPVIKTASVQVQPKPVVEAKVATAEPKKVEVQKPEDIKPKIDINKFIEKLTSNKLDEQANTMAAIATMAQTSPQNAVDLLNVKVVDTLLGIMNTDTSKLAGPTEKQLEIRKNIIEGKKVSEADLETASDITPLELAERNKVYSMYTVATLQKVYADELEKKSGIKVPMTELPGASGIVEQIKSNPNPMVRAAGLDALSYIQAPQYKKDLTTLFTVAQTDKDVNVQKSATIALEKLGKVADEPETSNAQKA